MRRQRHQLGPQPAHPRLAAQGFDRLLLVDHLLQQPPDPGRGPLPLLGQPHHPALHHKARHHHQHPAQHQHPDHIPPDRGDKDQEHEDERNIRHCPHGRRGKELAHRPEFAHRTEHLRRAAPRLIRPCAQNPVHQQRLHRQFDLLACAVHQLRPRHFQRRLHDQRQNGPRRQNPQRRLRLMRNDPVIHLKREQRDRHRQQIGNE